MVRTELDTGGLEKGAQRVEGSLGGLKAIVGKLGKTIQSVFTLKEIVEFAGACLDLQSEAERAQRAVETAFGGMAYKMEAFAKDAVTQFGMSSTTAKNLGSEYMQLAKSAGLAEGTASDMAVALTGLTGDTASAFGVDAATTADRLKGIFTGEADGLRQLGVMMSGTNLQQYALTRGIRQNIEAMSAAQQAALRYAYVTDALGGVSGAFARMQESWTGQTQLLTLQWQEMMRTLGKALATVLLPAVQVLNDIVAALAAVAQAVAAVVGALFGKTTTKSTVTQQNAALAQSAGTGAKAEQALAESTKKASEAANDALAPFDELNVLQRNAAGPPAGGQMGGQAGGGGKAPALEITAETQAEETLTPQLQAVVDKIRQLLEPLRTIDFEPLAEAFGRLKEAAEPLTRTLFAGLEWAWYNLFVPLAAWTIENLLPAFLDLLAAACRVLTSVLQALQPLGLWLWNSFLQPLAQWTGEGIVGVLQGITNGLNGLADWIAANQILVENIATAIGILTAVIGAAVLVYNAWAVAVVAVNAVVSLWNMIAGVGAAVTAAFGGAIAFLMSPITLVILAIGALIAIVALLVTHWDTVKEVALNVWLWIQEIWGAVAAWFQEFVLGPLGEFFSFLWQGIQTGALAVWESIQSAFATAADWFYNVLIVPLTAHFTALFTFFKSIFQGLTTFLSGVFTGDWKKAWEGIKKLAMAPIEAIKSFFEKIFGSDLGESIKGGLNALIDLVNRFIGWLNDKLHFSWDGLTIGGKEIFAGGSIRLANIPSIPRLAQGAVLPANKPFLAMVGEQRRGTNVEAPLETIKQAVAEVLGQLGGTQEFRAEQPIEISLDGEVLFRAIERIRAGRGVQIGGAFANTY